MSESPGRVSRGLVQATRSSAATLLATGRTRLELLGNELQEEKLRAIRLAIASLLMVLCLVLAIILAVALLVVVYWDSRVSLLGGLSALFLAACVFLYLRAAALAQEREASFCGQHRPVGRRPPSSERRRPQ
jgi:uncharacterized membrane protein YqjE